MSRHTIDELETILLNLLHQLENLDLEAIDWENLGRLMEHWDEIIDLLNRLDTFPWDNLPAVPPPTVNQYTMVRHTRVLKASLEEGGRLRASPLLRGLVVLCVDDEPQSLYYCTGVRWMKVSTGNQTSGSYGYIADDTPLGYTRGDFIEIPVSKIKALSGSPDDIGLGMQITDAYHGVGVFVMIRRAEVYPELEEDMAVIATWIGEPDGTNLYTNNDGDPGGFTGGNDSETGGEVTYDYDQIARQWAATALDTVNHYAENFDNPHRVTAEQLGIGIGTGRTLIVQDNDVTINPNNYDAIIVKTYQTITFSSPILGAHTLRCFKPPRDSFEVRAGGNGALKLESGDARNPLVIDAIAKGFLTFSNGEIETSQIDHASTYAYASYPLQTTYADWLVLAGDGARGYIAHYDVFYPMLPPGYDIHDFLPDIIALSNQFLEAGIPTDASWDDLFTEVAAFEPGREYAAGERFVIMFAEGPQNESSLYPNDRNYLLPINRSIPIDTLTAGQALDAYTLLKQSESEFYFTNAPAVWSDLETLQGAGLLDTIDPAFLPYGFAMVQKDSGLEIIDALVELDAPYQGNTFTVIEEIIDAWTILTSKSKTPTAWYKDTDKKIYCTIEPRVQGWNIWFDFNAEIGLWVSQELESRQSVVLEDPLDGQIFFSQGAADDGSGAAPPIEVTIPQGYVRNADMPVNPARWYKIAEVRGQTGGGAGYVVFDFSATIRDSDPFGTTYDHMVKGVGYKVENWQWNGGLTNMTRIPGQHIIGDPADWGDGSDPNVPHSWLFLVSKAGGLEFWAKEYKRLGSDANVYNVMVANIFANWQLGDAEPVYYINPPPVMAETEGADAPYPAAVTDGMTGGIAMLEVW